MHFLAWHFANFSLYYSFLPFIPPVGPKIWYKQGNTGTLSYFEISFYLVRNSTLGEQFSLLTFGPCLLLAATKAVNRVDSDKEGIRARSNTCSSGTVFLICEYITTKNLALPVHLDIEYHRQTLPFLLPSHVTEQKG